jgi:predicted  nucleic acid-binding Zn-ribbon protein
MEAVLGEVTNELMYETLKKMQADLSSVKVTVGEVKSEISSMRGYIYGIQGDVSNIYAKLARHDLQLDRIENRLELRELAEAKARFEHAPVTEPG